ncbi:MAG: hypothetical protein KY396_04290 [Actinobacteria bacterium]|nr:hypothetical protein [Actinomycetota bacterium]
MSQLAARPVHPDERAADPGKTAIVMRARLAFTVAGVGVATVATAYLLFALANFGLAREEHSRVSVPLGEGALSLVAAVALGAAAVLVFKRCLFRASAVAALGTAPLAIFFALTVPEHSDWSFLFASLVVPLFTGATAALSSRRRSR